MKKTVYVEWDDAFRVKIINIYSQWRLALNNANVELLKLDALFECESE